ncbi:MAG: SdpI family protein, partial [Methanocorpusculum sp.]|nr:SdpI family protein [Methanocorpusculum sp.]
AIGNYLPKSKQSYTVGIRLPWTLNSEENWNRTHHLAGYLWILGGVLLLLCAFLPAVWSLPVLVILLILVVGIPFAYSYSLYRKGV